MASWIVNIIMLLLGLVTFGVDSQDTLEHRIETVFGNTMANTSELFGPGYDVIVQPDPIIEPTTAPQTMTNEGTRCTCVPYHLCDPTANGSRVIDIRFSPNKCQDVLDVCCVDSQRVEQTPTQVTITNQANRTRSCGIRNVGGLDFELAGNTNEAGFGEFPWTVALIRIADESCLCGGSLIHPQVVLTANHCVRLMEPTSLKIRAGEWDTQTTKERLPYQERVVMSAIAHPAYNSKTLANDIVLLIVDRPFTLDDHINTICLPSQNFVSRGDPCIASGWGKDVFGKAGKYSVIMKRVELPLVESAQCQKVLQSTRLGPRFRLDPSFICAGGQPGVDTCQGDGGAPLTCPIGRENRYIQSGIVSWGIGCKEQRPAVYAGVANFRDWIENQMKSLNFDTAFYSYE